MGGSSKVFCLPENFSVVSHASKVNSHESGVHLDKVAQGGVWLSALGNDTLHMHVLLHQLLLHLPLHILQLRLLWRQPLALCLGTANPTSDMGRGDCRAMPSLTACPTQRGTAPLNANDYFKALFKHVAT